ncbi:NAD-dependent protein [Seminavis robusta]|uniref:NAD-dependent protein n=1 Tax=Seminavis robusta TaxID=568900 RepID=A0A9N8ETN5_9STRA|nr:NAD-dependent protein [Seminavis robusta]|eukprot:Sro1655_g289000.1 NAD-dependent protein (312) ;mRNA; f:16232-17167
MTEQQSTTNETVLLLDKAKEALENAKEKGAGLLILTGAGMSVSSGVPVFRNADGSMSREFLDFLDGYNQARTANELDPADDWFDFSVPEMFQPATERPAWNYWRWRILRARVTPGQDYQVLGSLIDYFGKRNAFVVTSNCDGLHEVGGVSSDQISEIHGSLSRVQCSKPCHNALYPVDDTFVKQLQNDDSWQVPRCHQCSQCLRPNVMIFGDHALVDDVLGKQSGNRRSFLLERDDNFIVLEIGAGLVVPSIRHMAERYGEQSRYGLIRINPSKDCLDGADVDADKYFPIAMTSTEALKKLAVVTDNKKSE